MNKSVIIKLLTTMMLVILCITASNGQELIKEYSVKQLIDSAMVNNHNLKLVKLETDNAVYENKDMRSKLVPQIEGYSNLSYSYAIPKAVIPGVIVGQEGNITVEFGTKYNWNSGFKASQLIYSGSYLAGIKITKEMINAARLKERVANEEIVYNITLLARLTASLQEQQIVLEQSVDNLKKMEKVASLLADNGLARKTDVSRISVELSNLSIEQENLNSTLEQQYNMIKLLCGLDYNTKIKVQKEIIVQDLAIESDSYKDRTELVLMDQTLKLAKLKLTSEKRSMTPVLAFFAEHYYQGMRDKFDFFQGGEKKFYNVGMVGFNLSVPIFGGFEKRYKVKKAEIGVTQINVQKSLTERQFEKEMNDALIDVNKNRSIYNENKKIVEMTSDIYQKTLESYKQQVTPLTDLLIAENNLTMSRLKKIMAEYQLNAAVLNLKKSTGKINKN